MFSFFHKKRFLVDLLHGFVDIHNHILPGIDDGAKTVEESIALIKAFSEFGVNHFICTPHIMHNYYENTPETITHSFQQLKNEMASQGIMDVALDVAAEHMIDDNFENILEDGKILPLGKNHLLIEMSYLQPSINFDVAVKKILNLQLFPVFAHPERYVYLHNDLNKYREYKQMGLKFQLNALSVFGYYGKNIQKVAFKLLADNFYDFIATDTHGQRHINALKSGKVKHTDVYVLNNLIIQTIEEFKS